MHYPRLLLLTIFALMLPPLAGVAIGQDEDDLAKIERFEGGRIDLDLAASSFAILGAGSSSLHASVAPVFPGPGRHLQNPALLGLLRRAQLSLDLAPGISGNLAPTLGLDEMLAEETQDLLAEHMSEEGTLVDGSASTRFIHAGGLGGISLALPLPLVTPPMNLGLSMDKAFDLDFDLLATGMQAWANIEKEVGDQMETVALRADLDLSSELRLVARRFTLAAGMSPRPDLSLGVGLDWLAARAQARAVLDAEGIMVTSGREFVFGDPADAWENSLDQSLIGRYEGGAASLRLGAGFRPRPFVALGLSLHLARDLRLPGNAELELRRLSAYDAEGGFDPADLSLAHPTETEVVESPVADELRLDLPSNLGLGAAFVLGPLTTTLDWQAYWGDFALVYLDSRFALNPRHQLKLGIIGEHYAVSLGTLLCQPRVEGIEDWKGGSIPVPLLSLGGGAWVADRLRLDAVLEAAPLPSVKLSSLVIF